MAAAEWYALILGRIVGPMSPADLKRKVAEGTIGPDTRVRVGEKGAWTAVEKISELLNLHAAPPQRPPETEIVLAEIVGSSAVPPAEPPLTPLPGSPPGATRCPVCQKDDHIQVISAIVAGGQIQAGPAAGLAGLGFLGQLQPPAPPRLESHTAEIVIGLLVGSVVLVIVPLFGLAIASTDGNHATHELKLFVALAGTLGFWLLSAFGGYQLVKSLLAAGRRNTRRWELRRAHWEEARRVWQRLYYCARDHLVFDPASGTKLHPDHLQSYLYQWQTRADAAFATAEAGLAEQLREQRAEQLRRRDERLHEVRRGLVAHLQKLGQQLLVVGERLAQLPGQFDGLLRHLLGAENTLLYRFTQVVLYVVVPIVGLVGLGYLVQSGK